MTLEHALALTAATVGAIGSVYVVDSIQTP